MKKGSLSGYGRSSSDVDPGADGYGPGYHRIGGPMTPSASEVSGAEGDGGAMGFDGSLPASGSPSPPLTPLEDTGGPAIVLPAAALLLGSGILTYAILRRR
jgi:hypothetical protein